MTTIRLQGRFVVLMVGMVLAMMLGTAMGDWDSPMKCGGDRAMSLTRTPPVHVVHINPGATEGS
jgi:hypothetical protein